MEIREARSDERAEAGRVTAEAYREFVPPSGDPEMERYLDRIADVEERATRTTILVAIEGGRILGSATLELDQRTDSGTARALDPDEAHIRMLGVAPEARGRGVARALVAACEDRARSGGKSRMTLHTAGRMRAAQSMYDALGYERGADRAFPSGFVLLAYSKKL